MFGFTPYFSYGAALYFATAGRRGGLWIAGACLPAIAWHFLSLPGHTEPRFPAGRGSNVAARPVARNDDKARRLPVAAIPGRRDNLAGGLTYPLYLYHYVVLIIVTSMFTNETSIPFIFGMLVSVAFSVAMSRAIDPAIDGWREKVRGRRLDGPNPTFEPPGAK